jgi:very-short-patch-repair endonuclease
MPRHEAQTITRARTLRREATQTEAKLWQHLRNRQLNGAKFTRQVPIGPFIADFACRTAMLVIEIDGATHETPEQLEHDAMRSAFLAEQGYRVIRFRNEDIFGDLEPVLEIIMSALGKGPSPSHRR